jgi:hypothetical protein
VLFVRKSRVRTNGERDGNSAWKSLGVLPQAVDRTAAQ